VSGFVIVSFFLSRMLNVHLFACDDFQSQVVDFFPFSFFPSKIFSPKNCTFLLKF